MSKSYSEFDSPCVAMLNQVMENNHPDLVTAEVKIAGLFVEDDGDAPDLVAHGHECAGKIRLATPIERKLLEVDAVLLISHSVWDLWGQFKKPAQLALLDHEVTHLVLSDKAGVTQSHADGRPKLKLIPDDFMVTGFYEVMQRNKNEALETSSLRTVVQKVEELFPFMALPAA